MNKRPGATLIGSHWAMRIVGMVFALACVLNSSPLHAQANPVQRQIASLEQELKAARAAGNGSEAARLLVLLGDRHWQAGEMQTALDCNAEALAIARQLHLRLIEAAALKDTGTVYSGLGQPQKALDFLTQALPIWRELGDHGGEATTLNNIGFIYSDLNQPQKALDFYSQALVACHSVDTPAVHPTPAVRNAEAITLNNIGLLWYARGELQKAMEYFNRSLPVRQEVGDRRGYARTLNNIALIEYKSGLKQEALKLLFRSLLLLRAVGDPVGEAHLLWEIGEIKKASADTDGALRDEFTALSLAKSVGDSNLQGGIETTLMAFFRDQRRPDEAVFFGMDAVNSYQQIRRNISGLDQDLQIGFAQSKSETYRSLAELLVESGQLGKAEQVLDLLKEQELKEVVRGASGNSAAKVEPLPLSDAQQKALGDLAAPESAAAALADASIEYDALRAKATRTPDEDARLKELDATIEAGNEVVSNFFKTTLYPELAQKSGTRDANALLSEERAAVSRLQNTLAGLGPDVLGIRLLLGDQHAYAIVVTAHTREKFELKSTPAEMRSRILQARDELRTPASDPRPHLADLYAIVIAPLEKDLDAVEKRKAKDGHAPVLLWSLDGVLRYLPMAALYDGRHYMVERFNNVLFTPESYGHMTGTPGADKAPLRVLAMGLSKSYGGLPALPGVLPELNAVVHDPSAPDSHGPIEGKLLPDEQFTLAALKTELGSGTSFPVVHIASHFVVESGSGKEPYLMLGGENSPQPDGYQLTLSWIEDSTISFHGTELLTLSACSTAKDDVAKDGMEMDSLGMIAQQKDAAAVLATLWDVNDASTSRLMSDFYDRWVKDPAQGKAEALRQAQLALLRSADAAAPGLAKHRGIEVQEDAAPASDESGYAHPFYWAPFVLIGNYR